MGPQIDGRPPPTKGQCINIDQMLLSTGSVNAVLDFLILALVSKAHVPPIVGIYATDAANAK